MDISNSLAKVYELLTVYGLKVVDATVMFVVGCWVAMLISNLIKKIMTKTSTDETQEKFLGSLSYIALLDFVIIAALNQLGNQTTSFIAILGAAGLAIGLVLRISIGNFVESVVIILFKSFMVDDFIEVASVAGTIEKIQTLTTQLVAPDNKTIIVT